jgi:hypothetical protein
MATPRVAQSPAKKRRPPISIGSSSVNHGDLEGLRSAWRRNELVLFLGAGVSIAYGIPGWKNLVLEMLFDQTTHAARMRGLSPNYRRALSSWLADYFEYDPVILARTIEDDIRSRSRRKSSGTQQADDLFMGALRRHLYATVRDGPGQKTTLSGIADFIAASRGHIPAIVSFNFDDLLEVELARRKVDFQVVYSGTRFSNQQLPIIHPHGFVPRTGELADCAVVFSERHYHELMETVFHWALTEIVAHLRHNTVLFVGLSMSDPNLRRLLDACRNSKIPPHWQVQRRHQVRQDDRPYVVDDIQRRAREWGRILDGEDLKDPSEILGMIDGGLRQADTYDRQLFETMGVKTIWLSTFDDIPTLLQAQPSHRRINARAKKVVGVAL